MIGERRSNILHTRLRMDASTLNHSTFKYLKKGDGRCSICNKPEDNIHFLLDCNRFAQQREQMMTHITDLLKDKHARLFQDICKTKKALVEFLLKGSDLIDNMLNENLMVIVQEFIKETLRF